MSYLPDSAVSYIVVHYSATPIEKDYTAADIDAMHRARGFAKIGYHYFIRKSGFIEIGRDLSQPGRFEVGAHSQGENDISIGVCYEGGVRLAAPNVGFDSRTPEQIASLEKVIWELLDRFPGAIVKGHGTCPARPRNAQASMPPRGGTESSRPATRPPRPRPRPRPATWT